ncbi:scaffolding protein [Paenibacillus polymyxa]|uniref:phage scaffolding protein n=1 Tax=Paenibacillus polymyxa TaxID=1406 RepID=UPI000A6EBAE9|nr:scaffolding protein [Paenibacillus polymyxa]UMR33959.1 scaffolding protein [Paenibacillus polymyxa]
MNKFTNVKYPLNLQLFAEGDPDPTPAPPIDPVPPKTFTQDELDQVIADRIARERKKYADYDELKTKLSDFEREKEEREKEKMSVTERLEAEKAAALKAAEEARNERDKALAVADRRLIDAEFRTIARELNVRTDALNDALKLADLSEVSVDDEGRPQGVEGVVKALIEAKPYLVEQSKSQRKEIGGPSGGGVERPDKTKELLLAEAAEKARVSGKPEDFAAFAALKRTLSL